MEVPGTEECPPVVPQIPPHCIYKQASIGPNLFTPDNSLLCYPITKICVCMSKKDIRVHLFVKTIESKN